MEIRRVLVIQNARLGEDAVQLGLDKVEALPPETVPKVRIPPLNASAKLDDPSEVGFERAQPVIEARLKGGSVDSAQGHKGE